MSEEIKLKCFRCDSTMYCRKSRLKDGISCSLCEGYVNVVGPVDTNDINKVQLNQAIEILRNIKYGEIEGVGIETNTYQDGTQYLTINVDFK